MTLTSIRTYKEKLMADINLRLQISYNNTTYTTHLVEWINSTIILSVIFFAKYGNYGLRTKLKGI